MRRVVSADFVFCAKVALGVLGAAGSIASILALFMTRDQIGVALGAINVPAEYLPWVLTVIFFITLSLLIYVAIDYRRRERRLRTLAEQLNGIACTKARTYGHIYGIVPPTADLYSCDPDSPLTDLLNHIKNLFSVYTGDECSVCIKLLHEDSSGRQLTRTLSRDSISRAERAQIDRRLPEYPYEHNTAFKEVIKGTSRYRYFLCNNMNKLPDYSNDNENWRDFYHACLVVAIAPDDGPSLINTIEFLCVDNFRGGFDEDFCAPIMLALGKEIYQLFELYDRLKSSTGRQTEEGRADVAS